MAHASDNLIFLADHPNKAKGRQWSCVWNDHAARRIRRWLGPESIGPKKAAALASEEFNKYHEAHEKRLAEKHSLSDEELAELAQRCTFPRIIVAFHILRLCRRIVQADSIEEERRRNNKKGTPGLQLFAERTGISTREVHRLIEDYERVAVGYDTVDKICGQFNMLFDDFIEEARQWANKEGIWEHRSGTEDSWPVGYTISVSEKQDEDPLMECASSGFNIL